MQRYDFNISFIFLSNEVTNLCYFLAQVCILMMVHRKRFELLAFGSVDRRSIQLS